MATHNQRLTQMQQGALPRPAPATVADEQRALLMLDREIATLQKGRRALAQKINAHANA